MLVLLLFATYIVVTISIPHFVVNLDLPPSQRYGSVVQYYRDDLTALLLDVKRRLDTSVDAAGRKEWLSVLNFDKEYQEELMGMVRYLDHKPVTYDLLFFWNAIYEMDSPTFCTGILAAMQDGTVIHGRNMDFSYTYASYGKGAQSKDLTAVTHDITFMRSGKPIVRSTGWPGHVGIHSGMSLNLFGKWSIDVNGRPSYDNYANNLRAAKAGGKPHSLIVRRILLREPEFDKAVLALYASNLAAPCYMVIAGDKAFQGAILTLDRNGQHLSKTPPIQKLAPNLGQWFLVQTNDDRNMLASDMRRPVINSMMDMHTMEDVSARFMVNKLRTPPTFNTATTFSCVYIPTRGEVYSFVPQEEPVLPNEPSIRTATGSGGWQRLLAPAPTQPPHQGLPRTVSRFDPADGNPLSNPKVKKVWEPRYSSMSSPVMALPPSEGNGNGHLRGFQSWRLAPMVH